MGAAATPRSCEDAVPAPSLSMSPAKLLRAANGPREVGIEFWLRTLSHEPLFSAMGWHDSISAQAGMDKRQYPELSGVACHDDPCPARQESRRDARPGWWR